MPNAAVSWVRPPGFPSARAPRSSLSPPSSPDATSSASSKSASGALSAASLRMGWHSALTPRFLACRPCHGEPPLGEFLSVADRPRGRAKRLLRVTFGKARQTKCLLCIRPGAAAIRVGWIAIAHLLLHLFGKRARRLLQLVERLPLRGDRIARIAAPQGLLRVAHSAFGTAERLGNIAGCIAELAHDLAE